MMKPDDDLRKKRTSYEAEIDSAAPAPRHGFHVDDDTISISRSQTMSLDFVDDSNHAEHAAVPTLDDKSIFQRAYELIDATARKLRRSRVDDIVPSDLEVGVASGRSPAVARAQAKAAGVFAGNGKGKRGRPAATDPGAEYVAARAPGLSPMFYLRFLRRDDSREQSPAMNDDALSPSRSTAEQVVVARCELMPTIAEEGSSPAPSPETTRLPLERSELKRMRQECCITAIIVYAILTAIVLGEVFGFKGK